MFTLKNDPKLLEELDFGRTPRDMENGFLELSELCLAFFPSLLDRSCDSEHQSLLVLESNFSLLSDLPTHESDFTETALKYIISLVNILCMLETVTLLLILLMRD